MPGNKMPLRRNGEGGPAGRPGRVANLSRLGPRSCVPVQAYPV